MVHLCKGFFLLIFLLLVCSFWQQVKAQNFAQWENEITGLEKKAAADPVKKRSIVFTGSSSIRLWEGLPTYFPGKKIINHGFGGSQTDEVVHFADRLVTPYKPKQVVIYVGDNDLASGKSPEKVFADFRQLFTRIRESRPKATITFISIKPSPSRKQYYAAIQKTNAYIKDFLENQKKAAFVDIYTPMLGQNGKPKPELFRPDSLHMTQAGYDIWGQVLKPYLR